MVFEHKGLDHVTHRRRHRHRFDKIVARLREGFAFRRVGCPHAREDLEAETVALAWKHFVALVGRGKNPETFVTILAMRCAQAARSGR